MRMCGIVARFTIWGRPWTSLPSATVSGCVASFAAFDRRMSPSITKSRCLFGTSTPIADLPGIGAMIRTSGVASAYAMSLESCRTLFTLVPAAMSTSYIETVGPRDMPVTRASTPNVRSVRSSASMVSFSSRPSEVDTGADRRRSSGGS